MSEVKEGHQSEDMAEEATNQGRKDGDSTEKEVLYPEGGRSRSKDSTPWKEEKSHLSEANAENHGDGIHNPSTLKKQNSENSEGETASKSCEEENKDNDPAQKEQYMVTAASSSECANPDVKNGNDLTIQNGDSTENKEENEKGSSPNMGTNVKNHGDGVQEPPKNEPKTENSEGETASESREEENKDNDPAQKEQHMVTAASSSECANPDVKNGNDLTIQNRDSTENKEENEKGSSPDMGANVKNHGDGVQEPPKNEPKSDLKNASALEDAQGSTPSPQITSVKQQLDELSNDVETIGSTTPEVTEPVVPEITGGKRKLYPFVAVCMVVVFAILVQHFFQQESPPQTSDLRQIDIFLRQLEKVKTQFPNQRAELWNRSRIHLKRHLQTAQPTEPVSLILTAGLRAERTLICLAQSLAIAYSSALNGSFLPIDGTSKAHQDSDQVKLDIDRKLQGAFEGDKPVAIIHRFEELPPGSTLIFYRYCDHENAAYKKTFLIFTVLLGEEEEIPAKISLSAVEEMVDDHLQKKFLSHGQPVSFDMMDLDKYGGLWSRISHLILPVATEKRIELEGC